MSDDGNMTIQSLVDEDTLKWDAIEDIPAASKYRQRPWVTILLVVLVLLLLAGGGYWIWLLRRPQPVQYTQTAITTGNMSTKVSATGPISAGAEYAMNFATSGTVSEIDVTTGQKVKEGQALAKLTVNTTSLTDALNQAQLAVNSAQTSVNTANTALSNAQTNAANQESENAAALAVAQDTKTADLNACSAPTTTSTSTSTSKSTPTPTPTPNPTVTANCTQSAQDKFNQTQTQLTASNTSAQQSMTSAQNQVNAASNTLATAQAQEQTAQDNLNTATQEGVLVAPADATVAEINGAVGQSIGSSGSSSSGSSSSGSGSSSSSGSTASTGSSSSGSSSSSFMILTNDNSLTITAQVNEADIANVQVGQPAQFTLAPYPSSTFQATVSSIQTLGVTSSNVVTYAVILTVDQHSIASGQQVYPGMTATINITTAQRIGALLIPAAALTYPTTALQNNEISRSAYTALLRQAGGSTGTSTTTSTTSSSSSKVVLQLKNGKLVPTLITIGLDNGTDAEVLSGLQAGDEVVVGQTGGKTLSTSTTGTGTRAGTGTFGGGGGFGGGTGTGRGTGTGG